MRIIIFGTGGVGGYFGGRLAQAGEDVTFIARGEHLRAIKSNGLRVDSSSGDFVVYPAQATDNVAEVGDTDLIVLGVKAWQVPDAAQAIRPVVGPNTTVVPFQNGVDAVPQLVAELGWDNVIGGLCRIVSYVVAPGHIRHAGFTPTIIIGELDNRRGERIEKLAHVFEHAGLDGFASKLRNHSWIQSVQGAVATWSVINMCYFLKDSRHLSLTRSLPLPVLTVSNHEI